MVSETCNYCFKFLHVFMLMNMLPCTQAEMASAEGGPTYGSAIVAEDGSILVDDMLLVRSKLKKVDRYSPQQESDPEALAEQIESSLHRRSTVVTSDGEAMPLQTEGSAEVSMAIEKKDDKKDTEDDNGGSTGQKEKRGAPARPLPARPSLAR